MKSYILAAAVLVAAPAFAQDQTAPTPGGYQPNGPALQGTPEPGSPVIFKQAPDPNTAFPPPAPKADYPVCKKGQFDGCVQAGTGDGNVNRAAPRKHHAKRVVKTVKKVETTTTPK
ncbi:MAG: hypothetical protein QM688_09540 [Sphingomonas bacterium]